VSFIESAQKETGIQIPQDQNTILIIDDTPEHLELVRLLLQRAGFRILIAVDAREGLRIARSERPNLVISDIVMPTTSGIELCQMIRADADLTSTPVLLVSALPKDNDTVIEALRNGADGYIEVPFEPSLLVAKAVRLLERKHSEAMLERRVAERTEQLAAANLKLEKEISERNSAEESLRESEEKYRNIVETANEGIWLIDNDTRTTYVNQLMAQMLGYSVEEMLGRPAFDFIFKEDVSKAEQKIAKRDRGTSESGEFSLRRKDGSAIEILYCASPIKNREGEVTGSLSMVMDITERRQAEEALRESEGRFRQLTEHIREVFWMRTPGIDEILYVSPAYESIWGQKPESLASNPRSFIDAIHPEDLAHVISIMEQERGHELEYRIIRPDGQVRWIWDRGFPIKDESGRVYRLAGIAEDITVRKQAEEALRESEERFRQYFELGVVGMAITSPFQGIVEVNDELCRLLGYQRDQLLRMTWSEVTHPDDLAADEANFMRVTAGGIDGYSLDKRWIRGDGRVIDTTISVRAVRRADNSVDYFLALVQDITERKLGEEALRKSEVQLQHSQKMEAIGTLAGGVAHDFNNLLTAILGNTQLALRYLPLDDRLQLRLIEIEKAGNRASVLTRQLLAFGRRQHLERCTINLNDTIGEIMKLLRRIIGEDIEVRVTSTLGLSAVFADPAQIEQVVMNLAVNARDAMPEGGQLTVETSNVELDASYQKQYPYVTPGKYVQIRVSDTGSGIDAETQKHIFEPFFTTKEVDKGTGLGLSMVYGIIKQHDGHINVYSEVGYGTSFKIFLPIEESDIEKEAVALQLPLLGGTETILVAEDEEALRNLAKDILEGLDYTVLLAKNGEEAIEMFGEHRERIDLLLLDVVMPRMGGWEAYQRMREINGDVPLILMTGYSAETVHSRFVKQNELMEASGATVLQKPYNVDGLGRKVRMVLDGAARAN
jgi:two-component system cell cycle sensor histidine kinase/response regulator CckA